jgi:Oxidoreductase FAD-binding domain
VDVYPDVLESRPHILYYCRAPIGSEDEDGSKKQVIRPYTPVTSAEMPEPVGHFDLVVKAYPTGKMSKHIGELQVGSLQPRAPLQWCVAMGAEQRYHSVAATMAGGR